MLPPLFAALQVPLFITPPSCSKGTHTVSITADR
jgi:hypothetical protein